MPDVTLREIAERVRCTRPTESYAQREHSRIAPATRRRVQKIGAQLGGKPAGTLHRQMARVRSTVTREGMPLLGVMISRTADELEKLPTIRRHVEGVSAQADALGFRVRLSNFQTEPWNPRLPGAELKRLGIRGIVLVDLNLQTPEHDWALAHEFAAVSVGVDPSHTPVNVAINEYHSIVGCALRELLGQGFKRPGLILPAGTEKLIQGGFTAGFHSGVLELPAADRVPIHYSPAPELYLIESAFPGTLDWIALHRPDVLIAVDTRSLAKCIALAPRLHRVPIYFLDWHPGDGADGGVDQRSEAIGRVAVNTVVAQLSRGEFGLPALPRSVLVRETWVPAPARPRQAPAETRRQR